MLLAVGIKCALNLAYAGKYGWQRDELYYAVAGRHLQGGYVEFPPVTALASALAHVLFGWSLVGFRLFAVLAGALTMLVGAAVTRELGGGRRAQLLAAVLIGFSPLLLATNGLFQPVSFDQTATMLVLWLVLRLALGRGSWLLLGVAAGVGLETKYTLGVVPVVLAVACAIWRRDLLRGRGLALAIVVAAVLIAPNLLREARHGWVSVHWLLHPGPSATSESRPQYVFDLLLLTGLVAVPVAVAGVVALVRDRAVRPLGWTIVGVTAAYLALGGKSYYALPVVLGLAAGSDVVIADNYCEAGALELFGRGLPPVASADMTFRFGGPPSTAGGCCSWASTSDRRRSVSATGRSLASGCRSTTPSAVCRSRAARSPDRSDGCGRPSWRRPEGSYRR